MIAEADNIQSITGDIVCENVAGKSSLMRVYSHSPLKLIATEPVGDACHVVMSSFGGGMVMGDQVSIRLDVQASAKCVVSTQSSSKVYRSTGKICSQSIDAMVGDGALLAILPDPLCCFGEAKFSQQQNYELSATGNLIWLDWITSGRWARDERWQSDSYESVANIKVGERLVMRETLLLDDSHEASNPFKMGAFNCYAVLAIIGPCMDQLIHFVQEKVRAYPVSARPEFLPSFTAIPDGAIVRMLGKDAQSIQDEIRPIVSQLKSIIGGDPWARKW